jgi:hypothetical protein
MVTQARATRIFSQASKSVARQFTEISGRKTISYEANEVGGQEGIDGNILMVI